MDEQTHSTTHSDNVGGDKKEQVKYSMNGLEVMLEPIFAKFPHLPENGRKMLVDFSPWIALIFGALGILALLGVGSMMGMGLSMLAYGGGMGLSVLVHTGIALVSAVLLLMAYPGLKAKTKKGWNMVFYSEVVSVIGGVIGIVMWGASGIVGVIISALIGFYILFEIRSYYN